MDEPIQHYRLIYWTPSWEGFTPNDESFITINEVQMAIGTFETLKHRISIGDTDMTALQYLIGCCECLEIVKESI